MINDLNFKPCRMVFVKDFMSPRFSAVEGEVVKASSIVASDTHMGNDIVVENSKGVFCMVPEEYLKRYVTSTSDSRTVNNVMRHEYKVLSDDEKEQMEKVKDMGLEFFEYVESLGDSRELSLSKTKVEEAVMWAVKHITG